MPSVSVSMRPVKGTDDFVKVLVKERVDRVVVAARRFAPKKTHELERSIHGRVERQGGKWVGVIEATAKHALWVHDGTGLYGPRKHLIYPKHAKVLAWRGDDGKMHFARFIRGQRPQPFLTDALKVLTNPNVVAVSSYTRSTPGGTTIKVRGHLRTKK